MPSPLSPLAPSLKQMDLKGEWLLIARLLPPTSRTQNLPAIQSIVAIMPHSGEVFVWSGVSLVRESHLGCSTYMQI